MEEVLRIINEISSTTSRKEKEYILEKNGSNRLLKDVLHFVFNPYILTGLSDKKINKKVSEKGIVLNTFDEVKKYLTEHNTGTDYDIATVQNFINRQPVAFQDFYKKVFTKDLKIGITSKTLNKVYGKNFIPEFAVMLAKKFDEYKNKINSDFVITKKLDGNRLLVIKDEGKVKSFTRQGKQYEGLEAIESDIASLPMDDIVFDGELIVDMDGSTNEIYAKTTSKARKKESNKEGLVFYIFDMLPLDEFQKGQSKENCIARKRKLSNLFMKYNLQHCREVKTLYIGNDLSKVDEWMEYAESQKWEGIMVNLDKPYVCKRTDYILKVKTFKEADVRVVDVIEGTGKNTNKLGAAIIQFEHQGKIYECNCGSGFSDRERILYWNNPELIVGKIVTIGYFEISKNKDGSYGLRFPTWKGIIRYDKDEISMY